MREPLDEQDFLRLAEYVSDKMVRVLTTATLAYVLERVDGKLVGEVRALRVQVLGLSERLEVAEKSAAEWEALSM